MELGYTFPLQRFLRLRALPYGREENRLFCWDAHRIALREKDSLLLVNAHNRFCVVLYDLAPEQWKRLPALALHALHTALLDANLPRAEVLRYLAMAGAVACTRTHGRREVAYLNRAWEDVMACEMLVDTSAMDQPLLCQAVNARLCRAAGHARVRSSCARMQSDLAGLCRTEEAQTHQETAHTRKAGGQECE